MKHYQKHQSGRTLLEQLAVLAIVAVLVITALAGFTYARNKVMANRILSDVSLAYMDASEQERAVGVYPILFAPESSLFIETERQETASGKRTDLVRVPGVRSSVCKIVHQMTQDSSFVLLDWSDEAQDYVEFTSCLDGDNTMVFAYGKDIGCDCPEHGTCYLSAGCVCDFGYVKTDNGNCEEIICPTVKEIEDITNEYCCVTANGEWNGFCYCPEDYYFNGMSCVPGQGFCVYAYEPPSGGGYYADCAYMFSVQNGTASLIAQKSCPPDRYCILKWLDTDCNSALPSSGASTIYGRCADVTLTYTDCRQHEENVVPTLWARRSCEDNQYCRLNWSSDTCDTLPASGGNLLYGVCLNVTASSPVVCPVQ